MARDELALEVCMMRTLPGPFDPLDVRLTGWMARYGVVVLRVALGVVFLWFGTLKYYRVSVRRRPWPWGP